MMELFEIRLKQWNKLDYISGEIFICTVEETGTVKEWLEYLNKSKQYDEVSIRKINHEDTVNMLANIIQQQEVEQIYEMFDDDMTPFDEAQQYFQETNPHPENVEILDVRISDLVWETVEKMRKQK